MRPRSRVRAGRADRALKDVPDVYDEVKFEAALGAMYEHVYESYWGTGRSWSRRRHDLAAAPERSWTDWSALAPT